MIPASLLPFFASPHILCLLLSDNAMESTIKGLSTNTGSVPGLLLFLNLEPGYLLFLLVFLLVLSVLFVGKLIWDNSLKKASNRKLSEYIASQSQTQKSTNYEIKSDVDQQKKQTGVSGSTLDKETSGVSDHTSRKIPDIPFHYRQIITSDDFARLSELFDDFIIEFDNRGQLLFTNNAFQKFVAKAGLDYDPGKKTSLYDYLHPDYIASLKNELQRIAVDEQRTHITEIRLKAPENLIFEAYFFPTIKDGKTISVKSVWVDITNILQKEDTISILDDVVRNIGLGINVFSQKKAGDPFSFTLEMINEASGHMLRFSSPENVGKQIKDVSPLLIQNKIHLKFQQVLSTQTPYEIDDFHYQPDLTWKAKTLSIKIFPIPEDRVVMLMEDITGRKSEEQKYKMTSFGIENAGDMIFWIDENARFLFANGTSAKKYGYSKEKLLEMSLTDIDSRITMMQWFELVQILENKSSLTMESINKTRDGEAFPVEVSINKLVFGGKKYFLTFIRDVSERKRNDELEQKIQVARKSAALKQQFLANMSHEIRTPMTGIMGMTSLLMRTNLSPAQVEYVRNIKISSENLLNIINDVLDLSKIEAGKMELKPNRIYFREFVKDIKEMFQHQAQSKGLRFTTFVEPRVPAVLVVDDHRLKQIINNLLSNAFKFTDEGEVSVRFEVLRRDDKEVLIKCHVKDSGMGIGEENQKQIFEKFTQIDTSQIRPFEGTGLGLAICRELTHLMGGEISVKSEWGQGSIFSFSFVAGYDEDETIEPSEKKKKDFIDLKLNVLHVEDKLLNQKVVGFILFNAGCNVDFVKNGQEAIDYYAPGKYDIILMDIQMPVMDGITAYKELKRLYGDKLCPVIGLSANALEGDAQKYMSLGLDDYIIKPFQPNVLYEKLIKWGGKLKQQ